MTDSKNIDYGPPLTWNQLAELYPGRARIMPIDKVLTYFTDQKDKFYVDPDTDTIHIINKQEKES